jgi:cell division protein FtsB
MKKKELKKQIEELERENAQLREDIEDLFSGDISKIVPIQIRYNAKKEFERVCFMGDAIGQMQGLHNLAKQ